RGLLDKIELPDIGAWEQGFYTYLESRRPGILAGIADQKDISKDIEAELIDATEEYSKDFAARQRKPAGVA
ncbi:MAG TPA: hypothetical protein VMF13_17310, partial [Luteitalea sp.]|nr:hypothetical protein [Luteitalea sp.]